MKYIEDRLKMGIIIILIAIPLTLITKKCNAQKVKIAAEVDKFTGEKRVETNWCYIRPNLSAPLSVKIRSNGESFFLTLAGGSYGANVINGSATVTFLFNDKSTLVVTSTGIQSYDLDGTKKSFKHQYTITAEELKQLADKPIVSIRKSDIDTYFDFDIAEKNAGKLQKLAAEFINELN